MKNASFLTKSYWLVAKVAEAPTASIVTRSLRSVEPRSSRERLGHSNRYLNEQNVSGLTHVSGSGG